MYLHNYIRTLKLGIYLKIILASKLLREATLYHTLQNTKNKQHIRNTI